jgi:hypothetical protein
MRIIFAVNFNGKVVVNEAPIIRFENVTCFTPKARQLIKDLNFTIDLDTNLLVMGPSGMCGYNENEYKPNKLFSQDLEKVQFCAY